MQEPLGTPDVMRYLDYREYLRDYYQYRKSKQSFFSYQWMAEQLGTDSSNLAKACLLQRHIPATSLDALCRMCHLEEAEARYLRASYEFSRCRSATRTQELFEDLMALQGPRIRVVEASQYAYYSRWYHSAIFTLLAIRPFSGSYAVLASLLMPRISTQEAEESLLLLERLGLAKRDAEATWSLTQRNLSTGDRWTNLAVHKFQRDVVQLGLEALDRFAKEMRDISTLTVTLSEEDLKEVRALAKEFRRQVVQIATRSPKPTRVYQYNLHLFPLTRSLEEQCAVPVV